MIVRRFSRVTGAEMSPVSIKQAARAIAQAEANKLCIGRLTPTSAELEVITSELLAGLQHATAGYRYVPDVETRSFI